MLKATELQIFRLQHWSVDEFAGLLRGRKVELVIYDEPTAGRERLGV